MSDTKNANVENPPLAPVIIERLRERFPSTFCTPPRLLKIGILEDLAELIPELGGSFSKTALRKALKRYTRQKDYQSAMTIPGAPRFDLAGAQAGSVTDKEAAYAKSRLSSGGYWKEKVKQPAKPAQPAEQPAKVARKDNAPPPSTEPQGTAKPRPVLSLKGRAKKS